MPDMFSPTVLPWLRWPEKALSLWQLSTSCGWTWSWVGISLAFAIIIIRYNIRR